MKWSNNKSSHKEPELIDYDGRNGDFINIII